MKIGLEDVMVKNLEIENFTVFGHKLNIDFSPRINILIGENGTGKTHILKLIYALYKSIDNLSKIDKPDQQVKSEILTESLNQVFMPLEKDVKWLNKRKANGDFHVKINCDNTSLLEGNYDNKSKDINVRKIDLSGLTCDPGSPVFIPAKEVLSIMEGFVSLYDKYNLSYDITYRDICSILDLPILRESNLSKKNKWAMERIYSVLNGRFHFLGGGRIIFKSNNEEFSVNTVAEGFRKAGILYRLLETGSIQPGKSGPLLWDEPEANFNPQLMRTLVEILLELSRNGQQIIIATHDYTLIKWFDLLKEESLNDHVRYHSFNLDASNNDIKIHSSEVIQKIEPNSIAQAFRDITDFQIAGCMGELGK